MSASTFGFTLRLNVHGPHDPQRLGYYWNEKDGTNLGFEFAVTHPNDPELVALELEQLAEAIREKHRNHNGRPYRRKR